MYNKIILVTGVGGDIGQSVIKCLKDTGYDIDIFGCDMDSYAAGRKAVKCFFEVPQAKDNQKYLEFMQELVRDKAIDYILPTTETEIEFYDRHREYFKNIKLFINNSFIVKTFLDKYETVNFLKNNGLPYPKTYLIKDYNNELSFPLLLKRRRGYGGRGLIIINDAEELNLYNKKIKDAVIQEIVGTPNEEYTVGVFSTGKDIYSIAFKRCLGYGSLTKVAKLVDDDEIKDLAEQIAKASRLEGSLNIQLRKMGKCYVPFEINPRFSSTVYFRHYFGFQDVKWWLDLKENKKIRFKLKHKKGVGVRTLTEVFFDLD